MAKTYVGFALSPTMFWRDCLISRKDLSAEEAKQMLSGKVVSYCNPSHKATLAAIREILGISVPIPETAPIIMLDPGDSLLVFSARFTRRLAEGEKYSPEEVEKATINCVAYRVFGPGFQPVEITGDGYVRDQDGEGLGYLR